jgi:amino acid transporter
MEETSKYERAKKRVEAIKGFYSHAIVYAIFTFIIIFIKNDFIVTIRVPEDAVNWLNWNIILTPLLWGIVLLIHGIYAFRYTPRFLKKWETRKIREFIKNEEEELKKTINS